MKFLKQKNILIKLLAMVALSAGSVGAQAAATYSYTGTIGTCVGLCTVFTAVGQTAFFGFDSAASGPGTITVPDISNVSIALTTPTGGLLEFVNGSASASALAIDGSDDIIGGTVTLQGTGATTFIPAVADIDVDAGTWEAFVVNASTGGLDFIAAGTGSFAPQVIPVPAAAWLFGSALVGLVGIGRRRRLV